MPNHGTEHGQSGSKWDSYIAVYNVTPNYGHQCKQASHLVDWLDTTIPEAKANP